MAHTSKPGSSTRTWSIKLGRRRAAAHHSRARPTLASQGNGSSFLAAMILHLMQSSIGTNIGTRAVEAVVTVGMAAAHPCIVVRGTAGTAVARALRGMIAAL